jgi:hypothetical protein
MSTAVDSLALIRADLTCLLCGRRLGTLIGHAAPGRPAQLAHHFFGFSSAGGAGVVERLRGGDQLRCAACGGTGVIDEIEPLPMPQPITRQPVQPTQPRPTRWQAVQRERRRRRPYRFSRRIA